MTGYTCIYPTPYEFTANHRAGSLGTQSRLTTNSTLTTLYYRRSATVRSAIERKESLQQRPLIRLVRLVRTFSNEKPRHCGARSSRLPCEFRPSTGSISGQRFSSCTLRPKNEEGHQPPSALNEGAAIYENLSTLTKQRTYFQPSGHQTLDTPRWSCSTRCLFPSGGRYAPPPCGRPFQMRNRSTRKPRRRSLSALSALSAHIFGRPSSFLAQGVTATGMLYDANK